MRVSDCAALPISLGRTVRGGGQGTLRLLGVCLLPGTAADAPGAGAVSTAPQCEKEDFILRYGAHRGATDDRAWNEILEMSTPCVSLASKSRTACKGAFGRASHYGRVCRCCGRGLCGWSGAGVTGLERPPAVSKVGPSPEGPRLRSQQAEQQGTGGGAWGGRSRPHVPTMF